MCDNKVSEPAREGFLYQLWLERDFSHLSLTTIEGHELTILEKGVRNYDAGPDFSAALIRYQGQILRGDVEVHPVAGDWYHHGHHQDARYNSVILHVVTKFCPKDFRTVRQDGIVVPTLNLDSFLESTAEQLQADEEEVPTCLTQPMPCLLSKQAEATQWQVIRCYSDQRLQLHKQQFKELRAIDTWEQIFYLNIMTGLGYAKNQVPFKRVAQLLPVETIWNYIWNDPPELAQQKCEAYLFGVSGLLQEPMGLDSQILHYHQRLQQLWEEFPERRKLDPLKPELWQFFRLRPANFPTRRLAAAAIIIVRFMEKGFIDTLLQPLLTFEKNLKKCISDWRGKFIVQNHPFWSVHYRFEPANYQAERTEAKLIGEERSQDIIINIVIPGLLAYAEEVEDGRLQNLLREVYYEHPRLANNELTRTMEERVFHHCSKTPYCTFAWQQQGLIQIAKAFCLEERCSQCVHPFY